MKVYDVSYANSKDVSAVTEAAEAVKSIIIRLIKS